jgi:hypothetical protein
VRVRVSGYAVVRDRSDREAAVAVTACPEMDARRLRSLAWEFEKTDTDLCASPALLDVAGPRRTIGRRPGSLCRTWITRD